MVHSQGERLVRLLLKFGHSVLQSKDSTDAPVETQEDDVSKVAISETEPMKAYWEKDAEILNKRNQPFIDLFLNKGEALDRIPDTTEEPVKESRYNFEKFSLDYLPDALKNLNQGVPEVPKTGTGISNNGRDAGVVAGIVVAVLTGVLILAGLIAVVLYRHYVNRNVPSMNFDNPVYRKTTEDQFALEKNGYAPGSKLYPSTVGEEAQEPLNTPGTNDYV